jgi:putative membrane protein insertion efficiency factor
VSASATPRHASWKDSSTTTLLTFYKRVLSPMLHAAVGVQGACRFQPTCSEYAAIAIAEHGTVRGAAMALGRVLRCHPLRRSGFDPVPVKRSARVE